MVRTLITLLITFFVAYSHACENSGRVSFFELKEGKGFLLNAYYGADSYSSYFYGDKFTKGEPPKGDVRVFFKIDEIAYQQLVVSRSKYSAGKELLSEEANLIAHYNWELSALKDVNTQNKISLRNVENYGIVESKDGDGKLRKFHIWTADLGKGKQYYVSTNSSFGVIVLAALGVTQDQEGQVKIVIDNYMYKYRKLKGKECK
jgi:hypothetical protein